MTERSAKADLELREGATPGPWEAEIKWCNHGVKALLKNGLERIASVLFSNDAKFIAACPEMVPYWIHRAQEAEADNAAMFEVAKERCQVLCNIPSPADCKQDECPLRHPHPGAPLLGVMRECETALENAKYAMRHTVKEDDLPMDESVTAEVSSALAHMKEVLPGE